MKKLIATAGALAFGLALASAPAWAQGMQSPAAPGGAGNSSGGTMSNPPTNSPSRQGLYNFAPGNKHQKNKNGQAIPGSTGSGTGGAKSDSSPKPY